VDVNRIALALSLAHNVVPGDWDRIDGTPREIWELLRCEAGLKELGQRLGHLMGPVDWGVFETQLERVERCGARILSRWDAQYPWRLRQVASPPPLVFARGEASLWERAAVAVVGTRAPSSAGAAFATRLARAIASQGVVVVSGLARGIDAAAHRGALEGSSSPRRGGTVAVLGTGVDVAYPPENAELMDRIVAEGCVVSEQLCGTEARPFVFPRRNRIISALCEGVVVVEGGLRSGALITARWALEQGRDVGAVPGFPGDFRSAGPNYLVKSGAFVVEDATDVFANLPRLGVGWAPTPSDKAPSADTSSLGADAERVYALVVRDVDADELARASGLEAGRVQEILGRLEIEGYLKRDDGGRFARAHR
jgi:DNA processing protein